MKTLLFRSIVLLFAGLALSIGVNAIRPDGIPLVRPTAEELVRQEGIHPVHLDTARMLLADPRVLFLDARPPNVFKRGRIPGAVNFPDMEFQDRIAAFRDSVPLDRPLVTYCDGIECRASEELAKALGAVGYKYIHLFFGGWVEWRDAGEAVEK